MPSSTPLVRRAAVAAGIVTLLAAGWWALRAPAIEHRAVASPPEIDIDPPAMRARREAAIALAMTPDDPWTFAESLAASAPPAKAPDRKDCGIADGPKYSRPADPDEPLVQTGGASPRFLSVQARLDAALRASADPLDRAVADLVNAGQMRSEGGRDEAVVRQAVTSTDPRLYALAFGLCHRAGARAPSCGAISLERWTQIDPGNGIPWLWMLDRAQDGGDAAASRAALSQLAAATRFDVRVGTAVGAVVSRLPKDELDLAAVNGMAFDVVSVTASFPSPDYRPLFRICRDRGGGDPAVAQQCLTIGDVMFSHSDSLMTQAVSGGLLVQTTGDESRHEIIHAERALAAAHWSPGTGFSECGEMRESLKRLQRSAEIGEVEAMRERARQFVTP